MRIFLDSANLLDIRAVVETGLLEGLTTNPTLLAQEKSFHSGLLKDLCELVPGPVSLQVSGHTASEMIEQGKRLYGLAPNVVVKVPLTPDGLKVCRALRMQNIPVNVTLCFSLSQALLASRAGATYVSPFLGRLEDGGQDPEELLLRMRELYDQHDSSTLILAASIRNTDHAEMAALAGAHVATMPASVFWSLYDHPLTTQGLAKFAEDSHKASLD